MIKDKEEFEKQVQLKQQLNREFDSIKRTEFWKVLIKQLIRRRDYFARKCVTDKVTTDDGRLRLIEAQGYVQVLEELLGLPDKIIQGKIA